MKPHLDSRGPQGWTMKRLEARGGVPGISREELEKIQIKY